MAILIIVIALLLGYAAWYVFSLHYVRLGEKFIQMTGSYLEIIEMSGVLDAKKFEDLPRVTAIDSYFKAEFYPQNPKPFFEQMEYAYQLINDVYEQIKDKEIHFQSSDWFKVRCYHETLEDIHSKMRMKKWQNFGLKWVPQDDFAANARSFFICENPGKVFPLTWVLRFIKILLIVVITFVSGQGKELF